MARKPTPSIYRRDNKPMPIEGGDPDRVLRELVEYWRHELEAKLEEIMALEPLPRFGESERARLQSLKANARQLHRRLANGGDYELARIAYLVGQSAAELNADALLAPRVDSYARSHQPAVSSEQIRRALNVHSTYTAAAADLGISTRQLRKRRAMMRNSTSAAGEKKDKPR